MLTIIWNLVKSLSKQSSSTPGRADNIKHLHHICWPHTNTIIINTERDALNKQYRYYLLFHQRSLGGDPSKVRRSPRLDSFISKVWIVFFKKTHQSITVAKSHYKASSNHECGELQTFYLTYARPLRPIHLTATVCTPRKCWHCKKKEITYKKATTYLVC